ncbi:hypothetical protein D9M68_311580 [compost metagenome]
MICHVQVAAHVVEDDFVRIGTFRDEQFRDLWSHRALLGMRSNRHTGLTAHLRRYTEIQLFVWSNLVKAGTNFDEAGFWPSSSDALSDFTHVEFVKLVVALANRMLPAEVRRASFGLV